MIMMITMNTLGDSKKLQSQNLKTNRHPKIQRKNNPTLMMRMDLMSLMKLNLLLK
jgi:hypothetical protein